MLSINKKDDAADLPERWTIGIARRDVAFYVVLALIAGFAIGLVTARSLDRKQNEKDSLPGTAQAATSQRTEATQPTTEASSDSAASTDFKKVSRIIRADTLEVEGVGPVRMIGIETPDGKQPREIYGAHGQKAVAFVEQAMLNQDVRLEFDPAYTAQGNRNAAGETLAYVYTRDGTFINGEILKQGLAFVRSDEQFKYGDDFRSFEREAMRTMRGVWGTSSSTSDLASTQTPGSTQTSAGSKLTPLAPSTIGPNLPTMTQPGSSTMSPITPSEASVYISADKLYHRNSDCELVDKKKQALPISQAKSRGYTPCSRCYPSNTMKVH